MALPGPAELLDLPNGGEVVTRVTRYEEGELLIRPPRAPEGKTVPAIRLHVPRDDKGTEPAYWDVTGTTLHPSLRELLPGVVRDGRYIRIVKMGIAPRARFSLAVLPADYRGPARLTGR